MKRRLKSIEVTAYHEAGHVVARWALSGMLPDEVIVTPRGGITKGPALNDLEDLKQNAKREVMVYMAGPRAEKMATGRQRSRSWNRQEHGDHRQAASIIRETSLRMSRKTAEREVAGLLWKHWALIERVAQALLEQGHLSQKDLMEIFPERR